MGLLKAGWRGLFAIEQSPDAFRTFRHNLIDKNGHNEGNFYFNWPEWLPKKPFEIREFIRLQRQYLDCLSGKIQLIAGGPPCQGFSVAGRRKIKDPRNELFKHHLELVDIVKPELVLLENVQGIEIALGQRNRGKHKRFGRPRKSYAGRIKDTLAKHGYFVQQAVVKAVDFGVPQLRPRYFTLGIKNELVSGIKRPDFFAMLNESRARFLRGKGLPSDKAINVAEAISDLETAGKKIAPCTDEDSPSGFTEIVHEGPLTQYQRLMHGNMDGRHMNSMRLVNHRPETIEKFKNILSSCRKGIGLSENDRERLGISKTAIAPLAPDLPSHTLTTIPDDLLHYSEPRVHTVREQARLQSFPDWFEFKGKFTTGGDRRIHECPRYTQVGNAVPPLLAEAIGIVLINMLKQVRILKHLDAGSHIRA